MSDDLYGRAWGGFATFDTCAMFCFVERMVKDEGCLRPPAPPANPEVLSQLLLSYFEQLVKQGRIHGIDATQALCWTGCDWDELYPEAVKLWAGDAL